MTSTRPALHVDWLSLCRRAVSGLERVLAAAPTTAERSRETGTRGSGGDRTLAIDRAAEDVILAELEALHARGARFTVVSEERGELDYGDGALRVIVDPIDGSLNAKRAIPHHALSIAVANGELMRDVEFAFVHDFGPAEEWWAARGEGAWLGGRRLDPAVGERRAHDGRLEVLGIESADPRWVAASIDRLAPTAYRLRAIGTIAAALCQVAAARFDGMVTLTACRGVDAAAAQLIVREAGGLVDFPGAGGMVLDAVPRAPVIAARTRDTLAHLETIVGPR